MEEGLDPAPCVGAGGFLDRKGQRLTRGGGETVAQRGQRRNALRLIGERGGNLDAGRLEVGDSAAERGAAVQRGPDAGDVAGQRGGAACGLGIGAHLLGVGLNRRDLLRGVLGGRRDVGLRRIGGLHLRRHLGAEPVEFLFDRVERRRGVRIGGHRANLKRLDP